MYPVTRVVKFQDCGSGANNPGTTRVIEGVVNMQEHNLHRTAERLTPWGKVRVIAGTFLLAITLSVCISIFTGIFGITVLGSQFTDSFVLMLWESRLYVSLLFLSCWGVFLLPLTAPDNRIARVECFTVSILALLGFSGLLFSTWRVVSVLYIVIVLIFHLINLLYYWRRYTLNM